MAEINNSAGADRHQKGMRSKKLSTRVDLTPMVDLGFLLITFFIFTTSMSEPKALKLIMPVGETSNTQVGESAALTVIPLIDNKIFYYHGDFDEALKTSSYGFTNYSLQTGIGEIIRAKQQAMDKSKKVTRKDLMLIIKPSADSRYENLVNTLDEVLINDVRHYALVDISAAEKKFISEHKN